MPRISFSLFMLLATAAFFAGAFLCETPVAAQAAGGPEPVKIVTADGVRLTGQFYASGKKNSPTVIMLHPIGDGKSSKSQDWKNLAETLQKGGYSAMMFDFRGHGESTTIDSTELFRAHVINRQFSPKKKEIDELDVKDYIKNGAYLSVLVNDIAAVKAYLDRKNDEGICNTANTIVIGADSGATLGELWINSELNRYKYTPPALMKPAQFEKRSEGKDIIAGIFFTPQSSLNSTKTVSVSGLLTNACKTNGMAALFFYGKDDTKAKSFNKGLEKNLKVKDSKKHEYIHAIELDTNLAGVKLLQKGLKFEVVSGKKESVNDGIVTFLDVVVGEKGNEWGKRDFAETYFMWRHPTNAILPWPAKNKKAEKNLNFDTYEKFITN